MILRILFTSVCFWCAIQCCAQRYFFVNYNVQDGLAQSQVTGVAQDASGCLWISSLGGVSRFDGREFTNYSAENGLLSNFSTAVLVDDRNMVWVGSQLGLTRFDGRKFTNFRLAARDRSSLVSSLVAGSRPSQVFAVFDAQLYECEGDDCRRISVVDSFPVSVVGRNARGDVFAAVPGKGLFRKEGSAWNLHVGQESLGGPSTVVRKIAAGAASTWLLTTSGLYEMRDGDARPYSVALPPGVVEEASSICEDRQGQLWLGTLSGVYRVNAKAATAFEESNGYADNATTYVFDDREGNIWLGTNGSGIYRFSGDQVSYFGRNDLSNPVVVGLASRNDGSLWFGTYGGGIYSFDGRRLNHHIISASSESANIVNFCLFDSEENLWVGTLGGGLWLFDGKNFQNISRVSGAADSVFYCGLRTPEGLLYFGTPRGLYKFSGGRLEKLKGINSYISCLALGSRGNVLAGTSQGPGVLSRGSLKFTGEGTDLETSIILAIVSRGDTTYFATADKGIILLDAEGRQVGVIDKKAGLSSNSIYSLQFDHGGRLWAGTGFFINCIEFGDRGNVSVKSYDRSEGILAPESNQHALLVKDSAIWAGTNNGLYRIDLTASKSKTVQSPFAFLKSVSLFSKPVSNPAYFDSLTGFFQIPLGLQLPHGKNHLTFGFQGVHLSNPEDVRYQYYIEGLEEGYGEPTSLNSIVYSSLPPGNYTLHVRAFASDDSSHGNTLSYPFVVATPFYQTTTFRIFGLLALVFIGFIIQGVRTRVRFRKHLAVEKLRADERRKVRQKTAEDFHDDIGNKITSIGLLTEVLKSKIAGKGEAFQVIRQIQENTQELYAGTRDIIWSLGNESGSLYDLMERLKDFGLGLFQETETNFSLEGNGEDFKALSLDADVNRNLLMIFKEAMHNSLKYAGAKNVILSVNNTPGQVRISLYDDGVGFDAGVKTTGNGMANMKSRAKRIGGEINFQSMAGGTFVELRLSLP